MSSDNKNQEKKKKKKFASFGKLVTGFKKAFNKKKNPKKDNQSNVPSNLPAPAQQLNPDLRWDEAMLDVLKVIACAKKKMLQTYDYTSSCVGMFV